MLACFVRSWDIVLLFVKNRIFAYQLQGIQVHPHVPQELESEVLYSSFSYT